MIEIQDGNYPAVVVEHYIAASKEKGTLSVQFILRVDAGNGVDMYADLWLTPNTVGRTIETLEEVFGWRGTSFDALHNTGILKDMKCSVKIANEEYDGKVTPKIKFINPARRQAGPLTDGMREALKDMDRHLGKAQTEFEKFEANRRADENDLPF